MEFELPLALGGEEQAGAWTLFENALADCPFAADDAGLMLDHIFITVADVERSIAFYERALAPLGIEHAVDYDGADGPPGHPDLKGFGRDNRVSFWLRVGTPSPEAVHMGFLARSEAEVQAFYDAAIAAGATDNGAPGARVYYDPRYYAANVFDPEGYSLEAVYKSWQHPRFDA